MRIDWLYPDKSMNTVVSHLKGVIGAVRSHADDIGDAASAKLESHRFYGDDTHAEIEVDTRDVDSIVSLVDPAALSIEFGTKHMRGLYIVTGAAGLA
jgi:hypothetical protein